MAAAVTDRTKVVIVCSPNNPTGPAVRRAELEAFLDRVPSHVVVVLDEAYREFVRDEDPFDGVEVYRSRPNVVAMRTFAKAYGLAGFRVGYAVAAAADRGRRPRLRAAVRGLVGRPGRGGRVAGARGRAARAGRRHRRASAPGWPTALRGQGWDVPDAQGNFVVAPARRPGRRTSPPPPSEAGVMVRPFAGDGRAGQHRRAGRQRRAARGRGGLPGLSDPAW